MHRRMGVSIIQIQTLLCLFFIICLPLRSCQSEDPSPKPWPEQFHAKMFQTLNGKLSIVDLWYDWPNGRNFNIIQHQLSQKLWDLEWTNGTSYYYDLEAKTCFSIHFPVGILRPDWLVDQSHYLGVKEIDGFICNVWEKADFITYYEDVQTHRPVAWLFRTSGQFVHILTFEVGAVLPDTVWQPPSYCFSDTVSTKEAGGTGLFPFWFQEEMPSNMISSVVPLSSSSLGHVESS